MSFGWEMELAEIDGRRGFVVASRTNVCMALPTKDGKVHTKGQNNATAEVKPKSGIA